MTEPKSITILGVFKDNEVIDHETGNIISCTTYSSVRKIIENKLAFLHLTENEYGDLYIYQYVLVE